MGAEKTAAMTRRIRIFPVSLSRRASCSLLVFSPSISFGVYPAFVIADLISVRDTSDGSYAKLPVLVARFTWASEIPSSFLTALSTAAEQDAQDIPSIASSVLFAAVCSGTCSAGVSPDSVRLLSFILIPLFICTDALLQLLCANYNPQHPPSGTPACAEGDVSAAALCDGSDTAPEAPAAPAAPVSDCVCP